MAACARNDAIAAKELLEAHGVEVCHFGDTLTGMAGLHYAVYHNDHALCQAMVVKGAKVDPLDVARMTPLHYACYAGDANLEIVTLLCDYCANLTAQDTLKQTPLHWAVFEGHVKTCNNLLSWEGGDEALRVSSVMEQMPVDLARTLPEAQKASMLELLFKEHPARVPKMAAPRRTAEDRQNKAGAGGQSPRENKQQRAWTPRHPWRPTFR